MSNELFQQMVGDRAVMQQALDALRSVQDRSPNDETNSAINTLREALAAPQPAQEQSRCEELAGLGWQAIECPSCGSSARGYLQPAQPEQEPVAFSVQCSDCGGDGLDAKDANYRCMQCCGFGFVERLLYTTPQPQRIALTDEQIKHLWEKSTGQKMPNMGSSMWQLLAVARAIEAAHGIKEKS